MNDAGSRVSERRFTEAETADLLGVSKMTVRRKRESGELRYYRIGMRILIAESHILEFLKRNEFNFNCELKTC